MRFQTRASQISQLCLPLLCALLVIALAAATAWAKPTAQRVVRPLPASDYSLLPSCGAPRPGRAACLAVQLVPRTAAAKAHARPLGMARSVPLSRKASEVCSPPTAAEGCYGLRPQDLHSAYKLPASAPSEQTIALVDAYDDPNIEADLKVYDEALGLSACTSANGCFKKVNQSGAQSPLPAREGGWATEISLDVEIAHATCPNCHILLVEAQSASYANLEAAETTAVSMGADEISNSWGGSEPVTDSSAFEHPGVVITASTGDDGYLNWDNPELASSVGYPASSPDVVAVGGTRLDLTPEGVWAGETVWNGGSSVELEPGGAGGSGCSTHFSAPSWQLSLADWSAVGCGSDRAAADISADADPYTGVAVYDTTPLGGVAPRWFTVGGTSLSSPLIAATFALVGGSGGVEFPAATLYARERAEPGLLHDVTSGSNGACSQPAQPEGLSGCTPIEEATSCSGHAICLAGAGYDGPTGLGTPDGIGAFERVPRQSQQIEFASSSPAGATVGGPRYTASATSSSGLAVAFASATPAVCAVSGATVSFGAVGTCTVTANQAGDASYAPAPEAQQSFAVGKGSQRIEFTLFPEHATVGVESTVRATASSELAVSMRSTTPSVCALTGERARFLSAGTCTVEAQQPGNANWEAAPNANQSVVVEKRSQTVAFNSIPPSSATVGGLVYEVFAAASSGLPVSFISMTPSICSMSGASVSFVVPGMCTIEALQPGNAEYAEATPPAEQSFEVAAAPASLLAGVGSTPIFKTPAPASPASVFELIGAPRVNRKSGAVTFIVSVIGPGSVSWKLTFEQRISAAGRSHKAGCAVRGGCRQREAVFGGGRMTVAAGTAQITVKPGRLAAVALAGEAQAGRGLEVKALLGFQPASGAGPSPLTRRISVKLSKAHRS